MQKQGVKQYVKKYMTVLILIAIIVFFSIADSKFFTVKNFLAILRQVSMLGIMSVGMACCMLVGDIDLSVGVMEGFSSVACALLLTKLGLPLLVAYLITLLISAVIGGVIGTIIVKTHMPAMIGSLGTRYIVYGTAFLISGGVPIYGISDSAKFIGQAYIGPIPVPILFLLLFLVIGGVLLNKSHIGRYMFAIGSNSEATRLSGINVDKVRIFCFSFCSFCASMAGLILMARNSSGQPNAGSGYELNVITACTVGGVSAMGGECNIINLAVGVLILGVLTDGMTIIGVNDYWQTVITGIVLICAVGLDFYQKTHKGKVKVA